MNITEAYINQPPDLILRISIPVFERIRQLYAYGHSNTQISSIILSEFSDMGYSNIGEPTIRAIICENKAAMEDAKRALGVKCREEIANQVAVLFNKTEQVESKLVDAYVRKLNTALDEMNELDITIKDSETGAFTNVSKLFMLIEVINKLQATVSKIVGTDALREVEVFKLKMAAKIDAENKAGSLLPAYSGGATVFV